ncbi:mitochondrial 54S ribosomal protein uL6m KNAG_0E00500 [Huiozyma naganishii CBS 8797]|uniref:Large ribosomal subunit protein uL6 alpha-beta domain-containing protein n=1 Tax=Huiozyma naganishii (strain ATCC MYA-139 / BCRC 22969 / CBS 8797 / KCTC 17520 / NBRC 10181 / NCYC 3082 / Yp74L-3) TaxID=1071383 RepID=J7RLC4_HUIN7|nr:hypothetical protein KNAG_0E00500 [Kazachstania naganishii CBS 8797]CCK70318.1 hypothetical protein KNAG_0E00500 [Kazachstania naganishii CBS 8797]
MTVGRVFWAVGGRRWSHVGAQPLFVPSGATLRVENVAVPRVVARPRGATLVLSQRAVVEGPLGVVGVDVPSFVKIKRDPAGGTLQLGVLDETRGEQRAMWGTVRALLHNAVSGVTEGHLAVLKFVGTGYRAVVEEEEGGGKFVAVKVGASVRQGLAVPPGVSVRCPQPTTLVVEGCDRQQVMQFAARIRHFHPPEPYKGKGIYVNDETIKLKNKKIK